MANTFRAQFLGNVAPDLVELFVRERATRDAERLHFASREQRFDLAVEARVRLATELLDALEIPRCQNGRLVRALDGVELEPHVPPGPGADVPQAPRAGGCS